MNRLNRCMWILVALLAIAGTLSAQVHPEKVAGLAEKEFQHADMTSLDVFQGMNDLPAKAATGAHQRLDAMGIAKSTARLDARSGRFVTLFPTAALIPGDGVGNTLQWSEKTGAPQDRAALEQAAWQALYSYIGSHKAMLRIDPSELTSSPRIATHDGGDTIQIIAPRILDGLEVRDSYVNAVIKKGNLILLGAHKWNDHKPAQRKRALTEEDAVLAAEAYLSPFIVTRAWGKPSELYIPMAGSDSKGGLQGFRYQRAWSIKAQVDGDHGSYEVLVDSHTGEILSTKDMNAYVEAKGGVYPVTNDGVVPDGVEQAGWPMPFLTVGGETADTGGNYTNTGNVTASLTGPFVRMNDNCGSSSLSGAGGLDFGTSGGDDCTTPGFGGAGNTHSSRSGFYELNRIKEMARAQLPGNTWLTQQLTSNMNINNTCNAFWNGSTVNFYRSGGGCSNTGEIAGVFDHEWGHGMDANDVNGGIASPSGEGIADIYTALRLNDSCIGRNFLSNVCSGNGDPCDTCTGVRDIDYLARQSNQPHDYSWSNANCGGSVHCVGGVYSEAVWSLWKRELPTLYGMNTHTAHELVTRLTFIGAGATGTWFSGGPPNGGCSSNSGYMNYLAADDDNGNLNDGTPHMQAIFNAFNTQEIACGTPTVQDSGCAGTPTTAPNVTATAGNNQVSLSWPSVSGATEYQVFRAEGIFGCDFGKVKVAESGSTSFTDTGLQNGRDYSYVVIPVAGNNSCMGPASACDTVQPAAAPPTPDFSVACSPSSFTRQQGQNATSTCTVTALNGYSGSVSLSCSGNPSGIGCSFSPSTVSPTGNSTLTLSVSNSQATGTFNFDVVGNDGTDTRTAAVDVTVTPEGQNGPQNAVYDAGLGAPKCAIPGSSCDSTTLLDSRSASLSPPEPNQPNTLDNCTDGTSGTYHSDESNDRIVVSTLDGLDFTEGATVQVDATVYAWNTGTADSLDLYYTGDANNPSWTLITTISLTTGGLQTLSAQYTLPAGGMQAVRANFRYQGSPSTCGTGNWDDTDDLVFTVNAAGPQCTVDADCDNGLFCDGTETCNAGSCQAGTAVTCDDGVSCTVDSCNEGTDSCDASPDNSLCDNGLFCDGAETCNATLGCQAGTTVDCNDGVSCTVDSCNEGTDSCDNGPDDSLCDNGLFCDGSETCNATLGCQAGSDPCNGAACDEAADTCEGPDCVVDDDFEAGAPDWTNDPASTCTTGDYITGNPTNANNGWQIVGSNSGVSSIFTATNTSAGVNDVDNGNCILGSPSWSVTNNSTLSVWYWHGQRDNNDDPGDDFFFLEYSVDDGANWITLASNGDSRSVPTWTNATAAIPAGSTVQVRMQCSDGAGPGDLVECGLDDVSICRN